MINFTVLISFLSAFRDRGISITLVAPSLVTSTFLKKYKPLSCLRHGHGTLIKSENLTKINNSKEYKFR